jgi:hypothetical protein
MDITTLNLDSLDAAHVLADATAFEDVDHDRFNGWVARRDEASRIVVESRIEAIGVDPNLRLVWPIDCMPDADPVVAAEWLVDLPLALVDRGGAMGLSLTATGTDLTWELAEAYVRKGLLPPLVVAGSLPTLAGRGQNEPDRILLAACRRTVEWARDRAERAEETVNGLIAERRVDAESPPLSIPRTRVFITPGARAMLHPEDVQACIRRHFAGNWGDLSAGDRAENGRAAREGLRLVSVYHDRYGGKFYVVTEADRSATTCLLPSEY